MSKTFGKFTYYGDNLNILYMNSGMQFSCGNFCSIADNLTVYLGGNHRTDYITTYPFGHIFKDIFSHTGNGHPSTKGNVKVGNDVWIGNNVTIMSGVTIGDGAVIACNSHVVSNIEPYSIVGGNPAKLIRYRFSTEQIKSLLAIKWWDWDIEKIKGYITLLCSDNIDVFIEKAI